MENVVEIIHNEFDTAIDKLLKIAEDQYNQVGDVSSPKSNTTIENGEFLKSIGFNNVPDAIEADNYNTNLNQSTNDKNELSTSSHNIQATIQTYQRAFPFHKFISYSQTLKILEKYNLMLGHASIYKGSIPQKNINEMKAFPLDRLSNEMLPIISLDKPLCINDGNLQYHGYSYESPTAPQFYICAPESDFIIDDTSKIGSELVMDGSFKRKSFLDFKIERKKLKIKDPIVLIPVNTKMGMLGFIINTKWGLEANDPDLIVPGLN